METHAGWIAPDWPAPANVRAICTTRDGGVSRPPYDSLNLGDHVGDSPEAVATNRKIFSEAIQARPLFLTQLHGSDVVQLAETSRATQADGCLTTARGVACTILVADCLPVLFATADGGAVAAAHAGWRGLAGRAGQGILESVWRRLQRDHGARADETIAWLGPCIGPRAFEVGSEVKAAFDAGDGSAGAMFKPHGNGKWLADLAGLARLRLNALGLRRLYGNDGSIGWCTVANPARFFSHRRDRVSGRFAASIWRTNK
jgi:YfiH family protein